MDSLFLYPTVSTDNLVLALKRDYGICLATPKPQWIANAKIVNVVGLKLATDSGQAETQTTFIARSCDIKKREQNQTKASQDNQVSRQNPITPQISG